MIRKHSISTKLITVIVLLIFFFGSIATYFVFYNTQNVLIDGRKKLLITNLTAKANEVSQVLINTENISATIAKQDKVISYLNNKQNVDKKEVLTILNYYNINNNCSAIYLIDASGTAVVSTDTSFENIDYSFRTYFDTAINGERFVDSLIGITSGELGYYFSTPIEAEDGEILGVAVVKLKPEVVNNIVARQNESYKTLMTVDRFGVIIYSTNEKRMYHSLGKIDDSLLDEISTSQRFSGKTIDPLGYQVVQDDLSFLNEAKTYEIEDLKDDEHEIVTFSPVSNYPFYLVGESYTDDISQQSFKSSAELAGFVLIAAVLTAIFVSFTVNRLMMPLNTLKNASAKLKEGNLKEKIVINTKDEFEDLATSLNEMATRLDQDNSELERKISERTYNLKRLNNLMVGRELKMVELKKQLKK